MAFRFKRLILFSVIVVLMFPQIVFSQQPAPPGVYIQFTRSSPESDVCPVTFIVTLYSQAAFEGKLNLTEISPPNGVSVAFDPNPVFVPANSNGNTTMTVIGSLDTPQGNLTLSLKIAPPTVSVGANGLDANGNPRITFNAGPCGQVSGTTNTTVTTIVTQPNTSTMLTTLTSTITTILTKQVADPLTYAWAIGATLIAIVLLVVILKRKS